MTLQNKLDNLSANIETLDTFAVDTLSRLATWLAPLVPAALVYHAMQLYIVDVGPVQALIAAASIELLGLQVTSNLLTAAEYNRKADDGNHLLMRSYVTMELAYVMTVIAIVVGLKIAPEAVAWLAIVMLSMLTLLSATAFVQRRQLSALMRPLREHDEWQRQQDEANAELERELRRERELAKIERANLKASAQVSGGVSRTVQTGQSHLSATTGGQPSIDDLLDIWRDDPHASLRTVADIVGRSKSWVGAQKKELESAGVIHVNGNGVEILR